MQPYRPIKPVISNETQRSEVKRKISRTYAISYIAAIQEISPGLNDILYFQQHSVTNLPAKPACLGQPAQSMVSIGVRDKQTTFCNKFTCKHAPVNTSGIGQVYVAVAGFF